jgi:phage terminase small subunit
MSLRQRAFVAEYIIDLNGKQAAIRAGYSPTSAAETASELLNLSNVAAAVERSMAQRLSRVNMTADTVLHEMTLLSNSRLDHYVIDDDGQVTLAPGAPEGAMAAIQAITKNTKVHYDNQGNVTGKTYNVTVKLWDKTAPLKLMGKHAGVKAFSERMEVTGPDGGAIVTRLVREIVDTGSEK